MPLNEFDRIAHVLVKHARDAYVDQATILSQWKDLRFSGPPDLPRAVSQYERFLALLSGSGAELHFLPRDDETTLDSIYVRDGSIVCRAGIILGSMGKRPRVSEPAAQERALATAGRDAAGLPVVGRIRAPGTLEGGDVLWLDDRTVAVGQGYRTNAEGIRQLSELLADSIDELLVVALPHWQGEGDVMHLMSLVSPVDRDLAVVYSRLLPVPFRQRLLERGMTLVEVPDEEFETMGTNVLAIAPRHCVILEGNPRTRAALEREGAIVASYDGTEISLKGGGGPTCLTRPLTRAVSPPE